MREIKFRAWLKKENRMIDPVTGIDFSHPYPTVQWFEDVNDALSNNVSDCFMEDCELLQYTGLKDKNGVDIYEGDIATITFVDGIKENFEVYYEANKARFSMQDKDKSDWGFAHSKEIEIIGNIYDNPELLVVKV